ncbi:hypothetical protein BJ742DRAFT_680474 [Cladochytrium replicatum]|nr:hypothetical protein BJ742DRAFT_680474 [Cladochytrium replicatum]
MEVIDYLDTYVALCQKKGTFIVRSIQSSLELAIEGGPVPDSFVINGNSSDLRYTRVSDDYLGIILKPMAAITFLRKLDVSFNEIGDAGASALASFLTNDRYLEVVNIASNNVGTEGGTALAKALVMNNCVYDFNISGNDIGKDAGMDFGSMLQVNITLKYLGIANTKQSTQTLMALSTVLNNNTTLVRLDLSNNATHFASLTQSLQTDVMVHWSKTLRLNHTLEELNFSKMAVTDWDAVNTVAGAIKDNRSLHTLDLSW